MYSVYNRSYDWKKSVKKKPKLISHPSPCDGPYDWRSHVNINKNNQITKNKIIHKESRRGIPIIKVGNLYVDTDKRIVIDKNNETLFKLRIAKDDCIYARNPTTRKSFVVTKKGTVEYALIVAYMKILDDHFLRVQEAKASLPKKNSVKYKKYRTNKNKKLARLLKEAIDKQKSQENILNMIKKVVSYINKFIGQKKEEQLSFKF